MKNIIVTVVCFVATCCLIAGVARHSFDVNEEMSDRVAALEQQNKELKDELNSVTDAMYIQQASDTDALVEVKDEIKQLDKSIDEVDEKIQPLITEEQTTEEEVTTEEKSDIREDELVAFTADDIKDTAAYTQMTFAAIRGDEENNTDPVKEDVTPWKIYEEEAPIPKVNPPMESHLTKQAGVFSGPSGKETYYNLNMSGVISIMRSMGYDEATYPYWVRDDGVKMFGDYVMVAANLDIRPKGTILECSLGTAMVVDTGGFAASNPTQLDIRVNW